MRLRRFVVAGAIALLSISGVAACTPTVSDDPPETTQSDPESDESELPGVGVDLPDLAEPIALADLGQFTGVARLEMGSNCTGTLIDTGVDDGPAYLITNGHCTGDVGRAAQQVTVNEEWFGYGYFLDTFDNPTPVVVNAERLEYSTMRGRDVAIVRLQESLGYLKGLGIQPIAILDEEPEPATPVVNIAAPVQDIPAEDWVLRSGECTLTHQVDLLEFHWKWQNAWANDCPGVRQGSSGSPLLSLDDQGVPSIAAVINTTTAGSTPENGGMCFLNRPCEFGESGFEWAEDTSYGVSVAGIGQCFGDDGVFALGGQCPLEVSSVWANRGGGIFRGGNLPNSAGQVPEVSLALNPSVGESAQVRTALVPLDSSSVCTDPATYDGAESVAVPAVTYPWEDGLVLPVDLPAEEGFFALCAVVEDDYEGAATVIFEVDQTPPMFQPGASVEDIGAGNIAVNPFLNPPELSTVRFTWVPGDAECPATSEFQDFFVIPLMLEAEQLPATYCIYGLDQAGNTTDVVRIPLESP